jgi:MFS family permease
VRFAALKVKHYKGYLVGGSLAMGGDHIEHALSYLVMWQLFHSPLLAGFAVISHWVPHLFFGVFFGGLAERYDCRRLIQIAQGMFMLASLLWGVLILTGSLQAWMCVPLLLLHGFASALWHPADQLMLYDVAGPKDLPSAVRLMATGLNLGMLVGPAFAAVLLSLPLLGPEVVDRAGWGMFINLLVYLPFLVFLARVPVTGHVREARTSTRLRLREVPGVLREVAGYPSILVETQLQAAVGLLIGVALLPLLPEFGEVLLGTTEGPGYGALLIAMALGAVTGGIALEAFGRVKISARLAIISTVVFATAILVFAFSRSFALSLGVLVLAGFANIISAATSQTIVQLDAPESRRGRFIGAYSTMSMGFRAGSGVLIGVLGALLGVTWAVAIDAIALLAVALVLLAIVIAWRRRQRGFDSPERAVVEPSEAEAAAES